MTYFYSPRVQIKRVETPHAPALAGGPLAMVALLEAVLVSLIDPVNRWPVFGAVAVVGLLIGVFTVLRERARIRRREYVGGLQPYFGVGYLQQLAVTLVAFGLAAFHTYQPGAPVFTGAGELFAAIGLLLFVPLVVDAFWNLPKAPVVGAATLAGKVRPDAPERAAAERAPWRAASVVVAIGSLIAWPDRGAGLEATLLEPAMLVTGLAIAVTALVLVVDAAEWLAARGGASTNPASEGLARATRAAGISFVVVAAVGVLRVAVGLG